MSDTYAQVMKMATSSASDVFDAAVADFRAGVDEVLAADGDAGHFVFEDVPAPKRLAPFATSVAVSVHREPVGAPDDQEPGDQEHDAEEAASGRLVLLHDPAGQESWASVFRLVAYVRADIEPEVAADPLLGEVGWSWLTEALEAPGYAAASGTVTRVITEGYGAKAGQLPVTGFELRASWSPQDEADLAGHVVAWCACLAAAAGLEPPGTRALAPRRQ